MSDLLLSMEPVPEAVKGTIDGMSAKGVVQMSLQDFRSLGGSEGLRRLMRARGATCWIAVPDSRWAPTLGVLGGLAGLLPFRDLKVVDFKGEWRPLPRREAVFSHLAGAVGASVTARVDRGRCTAEVRRLWRAPRQEVTVPAYAHDVIYLRVNVGYGITAGGSFGHIAGVVNSLSTRYPVKVFTTEDVPGLWPSVALDHLRIPRSIGYPVAAGLFTLQREFTAAVLGRVRRPEQVLFVYQRSFVHQYSGVVLSRLWRRPFVLEYNGSDVWMARHWDRRLRYEKLAQRIEDLLFRHAHLVVVNSEVLRDEVLARGVEHARVVFHANGVDPLFFDPGRFSLEERMEVRRRVEIPLDATVVGFIGTFGRWHGVDVLARVIRDFVARERTWLESHRVRFLLIGDGLLMPDVRRLLSESVDRGFVKLTGAIPQIEAPRYLAACDVLCAPHVRNEDGSRFFGSPTKLFEYMAMAKAIVASDLDQLGIVLKGGLRPEDFGRAGQGTGDGSAAGVLVEPGREEDLAAAIRFVVEHPEWRARLGATARRRILESYTWEHHVAAILEGFARVVKRGGD